MAGLNRNDRPISPESPIQDLTKLIELDPLNALSYSSRGSIYFHISNYQKAIGDYSEAIKLASRDDYVPSLFPTRNSDLVLFYRSRGLLCEYIGIHQQAIKDFSEIIDLEPNSAGAYYHRGRAYVMIDNKQQALKDLNKAIELDSLYAAAYSLRGRVYKDLGNWDQFLKDMRIAARLGDEGSQQDLKALVQTW